MPPGFHRREMLHVALGLAALPLIGGRALARDEREGRNAMAKDIVMIHGANEGGWCFDTFKAVFEGLGCRGAILAVFQTPCAFLYGET